MIKSYLFIVICSAWMILGCNSKSTPDIASNDEEPDPYFIHLSDVHLNTFVDTIGYQEDTGNALWSNTKAKLRSVLSANPPPSFVVYTGDLPAHYDCSPTCFIPEGDRTTHNKNISVILSDIRNLFDASDIAFFYLPGNNDALAGDYYSFADGNQETPLSLVPDPADPYPALNTRDSCGQAPCTVSSPHPTMGYYSVRPISGLRLIVMNSIILGRQYHAVDGVLQLNAGNEQMHWIGEELEDAKSIHEKVYLAMHIPPGQDAYAVAHNHPETWMWAHLPSVDSSWLNQFLRYTATYSQTIAGILYGHTHMDEVRRLYNNDASSITEVAISAPGITPLHDNNPAFKLVYFDRESKELSDFVTYYTTPNAKEYGDNKYRFSEEFGCPPDQNIFQCLTAKELTIAGTMMDKIYTAKHGPPSYQTIGGIEVKSGQ